MLCRFTRACVSVFSFHDTSQIEDSSGKSLFWSSRHTRDTVCFESVFDVSTLSIFVRLHPLTISNGLAYSAKLPKDKHVGGCHASIVNSVTTLKHGLIPIRFTRSLIILFVSLGISLVWVAFIYQVGVLGDVMDMCKCLCACS